MFSANPKGVPNARLLKQLHYDEAQEIASSGAKVLHPRCILPVKQYRIPLYVYATQTPSLEGTVITDAGGRRRAGEGDRIKKGITLVSMESPGMWHQVGFLADVFQVFKQQGLSVDLVSTSETNVTVSLDPAANTLDAAHARSAAGQPRVALPRRGHRAVRGAVAGRPEHPRRSCTTSARRSNCSRNSASTWSAQAANDLNFTFVVDEEQGDRLVARCTTDRSGTRLQRSRARPDLGAAVRAAGKPARDAPWWQRRRERLLDSFASRRAWQRLRLRPRHASSGARRLLGHAAIDRVHYAMKANPSRAAARLCTRSGSASTACRAARCERVLAGHVPGIDRDDPVHAELRAARGVRVGAGRGAHGSRSTTCIRCASGASCSAAATCSCASTPAAAAVTTSTCARPACIRSSACRCSSSTSWRGSRRGRRARRRPARAHRQRQLRPSQLARGREDAGARRRALSGRHHRPRRRPRRAGEGEPAPVDLAALDTALLAFRAEHPRSSSGWSPGRFLVAQAGVLLVRVTQLKGKGAVQYAGVATGMNSLIRPALYGAYHEIVNLTRLGEPATETYDVVGPICESGDIPRPRPLAAADAEGDVLLIATAARTATR
jgi:bifunctional diaminopimelate decarboxylase / aspartate kinase